MLFIGMALHTLHTLHSAIPCLQSLGGKLEYELVRDGNEYDIVADGLEIKVSAFLHVASVFSIMTRGMRAFIRDAL